MKNLLRHDYVMSTSMNDKTHTHTRQPYTNWVRLNFVTGIALKIYLRGREFKL
jgi:hypothetical protein